LSAQFRKLNFENYIKFAAVKQNSNLQNLSKTSKNRQARPQNLQNAPQPKPLNLTQLGKIYSPLY